MKPLHWLFLALHATVAALLLILTARLAAHAWFQLPPDGGDVSLALCLLLWLQVFDTLKPRNLSITVKESDV